MKRVLPVVCFVWVVSACGGGTPAADAVVDWGQATEGQCVLDTATEAPDYTLEYGCTADFEHMATRPLDGSISGARSAKTVIDTYDDKALYFLNAAKYPIHYYFCFDHLGMTAGKPPVPDLGTFNMTEYYSPYRRFWLGAITFYEGPGVWTYEIAPYDTSSAEVAESINRIREKAFFGDVLHFHPTSESVWKLVKDLPADIPVISTDDLYKGVTFLPLNPAVGIGQLRFLKVNELESGAVFVTPRDIVVLDLVPNDIPVVAGIITDELQTPLSHINVLSQNRGTPNMSLRGAVKDPELRALEGKWVRLDVDPFDYTVEEVTQAEAEAWWEEHKPPAVTVAELDLSVTELRDVSDLGVDDIPAFGGKASHYGELSRIEGLRVPDGFAIPVHYYKAFEKANGLDVVIAELLADERFQNGGSGPGAGVRPHPQDRREVPGDSAPLPVEHQRRRPGRLHRRWALHFGDGGPG
jgi:pyruvate,water dikinase